MFQWLGNVAARFRIPIIIGWIAAAAILLAVAPPIEDVASNDQKDFLPADAPFIHAQEVYEAAFPDLFAPSSTMVLIDAGEGGDVRDADTWAFMEALEAWLNSDDAPENITEVTAPTTDPDFADLLISPNNRLGMVSVSLSTPTDALATSETVRVIDDWLEAHHPGGVDLYQTGEGALNQQGEEAAFTTMDRTLIITIVLVIVALLAIYRSPVSPLIPLFAVTMAFLVTLGLLSLLADLGVIVVIMQMTTVLVVVMYGAGTDYCLFLISRFREEMADEPEVRQATRRTVRMVGETISSSAATIFVGFVSMLFAEIGALRSAGPMLALAIVVSLLAGLTLVPALLATLGNRAFWPGKASHRSAGRFYEITSKQVSTRPLLTILVIVAIMAPFSVYGLSRDLNYDLMSELPQDIPSIEAYNLLRDEMGGGTLFPLTVIVTEREPEAVTTEMLALADDLAALEGVVDVHDLNNPLGRHDDRFGNLLRVDGQLRLLLALDEEDGEQEIDPAQAMEVIGGMGRYLDLLAERFPEVTDDDNLAALREIVEGGLLVIMMRQGDLMDAVEGLATRFEAIDDAILMPPTADGEMFALLRPLAESYLTPDGAAYRMDVVLDDPINEGAMDTVIAIRDVLADYEGEGDAVVSGFSAIFSDLRDIMNRDELRAFALILAGIFVVLLVMLRSVVAPLYLIATVVLSFTCTLGLTSLFFDLVYDVDKLSWMLPLYMFVFLVALGIDYSIFLFGRIKEEVGHHGVREGVHVAVAATGAIITSAGVILAGTFAGMMAGEITLLKQLGFAVSIGVLIDTFVVRTILDPALATLFGRWTWWPGGIPKAQGPRHLKPTSVPEIGD